MDLVLFYLFLWCCFYGLGSILPGLPFSRCRGFGFAVTTAAGAAMATVISSLGYFNFLSTQALFWILVCLAVAGWIRRILEWRSRAMKWRLMPRMRSLWLPLAFHVLLLAPAFTGGLRFTIFQTNPWDYFTYFSWAKGYSGATFKEYLDRAGIDVAEFNRSTYLSSPKTFKADPTRSLLAEAFHLLWGRPSMALLYGTLIHAYPPGLVGFHYPFLCLFVALTAHLMALLLRFCAGARSRLVDILPHAFMLGFWGQYILDLGSWSQLGGMPLFVLGLLLLLAGSSRFPSRRLLPATKIGLVGGIVFGGAILLYPEGAVFFGPAFAVLAAAEWFFIRKRAFRFSLYAGILAGGILLLPVANSCIRYSFAQLMNKVDRSSAQEQWQENKWHLYYQQFLDGKDGDNELLVEDLSDLVMGVLGLYFATPSPGESPVVASLQRLTPWLICGLFFLGILCMAFRRIPVRYSFVWFAVFNIPLILVVISLWRQNLYMGGRALSYYAPFLLVALAYPLILPARKRPLFLKVLRIAGLAAIALMSLAGLWFGGQRILLAARDSGIHQDAPYPAAPAASKEYLDFGNDEAFRRLSKEDSILIGRDLWNPNSPKRVYGLYAIMQLETRGLRYCFANAGKTDPFTKILRVVPSGELQGKFEAVEPKGTFIFSVNAPFPEERYKGGDFYWAGHGSSLELEVFSETGGTYLISPKIWLFGSSLPDYYTRTLVINSGGSSTTCRITPYSFMAPVQLRPGYNSVRLSVEETPSVAMLPGGDSRELMLGLGGTDLIAPDANPRILGIFGDKTFVRCVELQENQAWELAAFAPEPREYTMRVAFKGSDHPQKLYLTDFLGPRAVEIPPGESDLTVFLAPGVNQVKVQTSSELGSVPAAGVLDVLAIQ